MNPKLTKSLLAGLVGAIALNLSSANASLIVTQNDTATDLVSSILGGGITTSAETVTGAADAFGTFTGGIAAGIGIESGIMLSSGDVADAPGPNSAPGTTTIHGTPGDPDLDVLAGVPTFDAAFLTFDFESDGGDLFFRFVFASEEYNEFVDSGVNDVFAFFLDGINIGVIPGTATPVSIDTVNLGDHPDLYNDNEGGLFDIEYDGFTDVFTASFLGLSPGIHTIRMGIADGGDELLDSTVFIEGGSFSDSEDPQIDVPTNSIPEPSIVVLLASGLLLLGKRHQ
ncbi:choice-of-anchor L domain-containing protein [Thalassotalea fusca]